MSDVPLLLIDGHQLLYRAHFGFPARITSRDKRRDLTGVFGFFALLRIAVRDEFAAQPEILVVFDGELGVSGRRQSASAYKAQRPVDEAAFAPIRSLPGVKAGLSLLELRWVEVEDAEADDVIASLTACVPATRTVRIMSADRDFYQLAGPTVSILNTAMKPGSRLIGLAEISARYGVAPHRWPDLVALLGDKSDNLPGIRGIGPVTAKRLLAGDLALEDLPGSGRLSGRIGQLVRDGLDQALATRALVRLRNDLELPLKPNDRPSAPLCRPAEIVEKLNLW